MNSRILVFVLDLIAAFLGARCKGDLLAENLLTPRQCEQVAQAAETGRQIAGRLRARREVLMKLLIGWRKNDAMRPVDAHKVPIALVPHQRIAAAADAHDVVSSDVAMRLLVRTGRHFGHVSVHGAVGEEKYQAAATAAAVGEIRQLDRLEIGYEVCFPRMVALANEI